MSKQFVATLLLVIVCMAKGFAQTPAEMNTKLASVTDSVVAISADWREKLTELKEGSKHFEELKTLRAHLEATIDKETVTLKKIKDVAESTRYRIAVLALLAYDKQYVGTVFAAFEKLKPTATEDQIKACTEKLDEGFKKEDELKSEITSAQNEFAKENKITLEGGE